MISPQSAQQAQGKFAIRRLIRGDDGTIKVVYVDAQSGQQLASLQGYQLMQADNGIPLSKPLKVEKPKEEESSNN